MVENKQIPAIRFAGFTAPWEQRKLLDNIQKITDFRGRTPKKLGMDWSSSGYLALSALNVKNGYIDFAQDVHYGNQELYNKWMTGNELYEGQVLFTTEAPMGNVAQVPDNRKYILSQRTIAFNVKPSLIKDNFLAVLLRTPNVFSDLTALSSGGTAKGVSQKSLGIMKVFLPAKTQEQEVVANLFHRLDNLITLHQRKYDKLVNIKKALLEKMFPQNGSDVPEIRFKGFTEAWEQRKFGDIAKIQRGLTYSPIDILESGIRVLRSSNINEDFFEIYENDVFVTQKAVNIDYVSNGDILITAANGSPRLVGKHAIIKGIKEFSAVHGGFMLLAKTETPEFLNASMGSSWYKKFLSFYVAGGNGAIGNLNKNELEHYDILIPKTKEQIKIGNLFENINNLITLHQRKCEKLKNIKKSLLEKMFI